MGALDFFISPDQGLNSLIGADTSTSGGGANGAGGVFYSSDPGFQLTFPSSPPSLQDIDPTGFMAANPSMAYFGNYYISSPQIISDVAKGGTDPVYYYHSPTGSGHDFLVANNPSFKNYVTGQALTPYGVGFASPEAATAYKEGVLSGQYPWQPLVMGGYKTKEDYLNYLNSLPVDAGVVKTPVSAADRAAMDAAYQTMLAQQAAATTPTDTTTPTADTSTPTMLPTSKAPAAFGDWQNSLLRGITNIAGNTLVNALAQPSRTGGTGQAPNLMGASNFLADTSDQTRNRLLATPLPYRYY